jgi:hypothetical protein
VAPLALTARAAAATRPPSAFCIWQSASHRLSSEEDTD